MTRKLAVSKSLRCGSLLLLSFSILSVVHAEYVQAQVSGPQAVAGEYIVKMKSKKGMPANSNLSAGMKIVNKLGAGVQIRQAFWGSEMMHIKSNSSASIDTLRANPDVEFVEPNYVLSVNPIDVESLGVAPGVNDDYSQSDSNVQVKESWAVAKPYDQGTKPIVAIIDTGLDTSHKLFRDSNAVWVNSAELAGSPGVDDDRNGYVDDVYGWNYVSNNANVYDDDSHGTHVAGIVLGVGQDILAYPVREAKIRIMPLKFLDAQGSGSTANAVSAMYYAVNMGAKVINNSWGGSSYSRALHEAYTYAYQRSVVIVSAAGNSNLNNDLFPMYPAGIDTPNNIAVAATTDSDTKASFSNFGATVAVAAPGVAIVSSVPGTGCLNPGCYQMMSGTSMASPFVAGLAAIVLREAPQLSAYQVRSIVLATVNTFSSLNGRVSTGGRVNALKAVQSAQLQVSTPAWSPDYSPVYKADRTVASSTAEAPSAAGCGLVKALVEGSGGGGGSASTAVVVLSLILLPILVATGLRRLKPAEFVDQRRQYARYDLVKDLVIQVGDQVINAASDSLSIGGLSFGSDNLRIDRGEKIKVRIGDLDQEVEGEVVWCSQKQSYGVRFLNITDQLRVQMSMWTTGMQPT